MQAHAQVSSQESFSHILFSCDFWFVYFKIVSNSHFQ